MCGRLCAWAAPCVARSSCGRLFVWSAPCVGGPVVSGSVCAWPCVWPALCVAGSVCGWLHVCPAPCVRGPVCGRLRVWAALLCLAPCVRGPVCGQLFMWPAPCVAGMWDLINAHSMWPCPALATLSLTLPTESRGSGLSWRHVGGLSPRRRPSPAGIGTCRSPQTSPGSADWGVVLGDGWAFCKARVREAWHICVGRS